MIKKILSTLGFGLAAYVVYETYKNVTSAKVDSVQSGIIKSINDVGINTMGLFKVSNARLADASMLNLTNVKAMLAVIRKGEGTADTNGYKRIFGGQLFSNYSDHPRILVKKGGYSSTAAGAYQFLASTWDETKRIMNLKDFSPFNQDLAALGRIAARGALEDVIVGRFDSALKKIAKEWASLPYSPYGQPVQTLQGAKQVYLANNGTFAGVA